MKVELYRRGKGWLPASEDAENVLKRMEQGEIGWFKPLRVRDLKSHRRYWQLMTMCADNCEQIELPCGGVMDIHSKDDVHTAIKLCTGHVTTVAVPVRKLACPMGKPCVLEMPGGLVLIPKSTNYESMTADEWAEYWPMVTDAVQRYVMPGIEIPEVEMELQKCMGWAR